MDRQFRAYDEMIVVGQGSVPELGHSMSNQHSHKTSLSLILSKVCDIIVNVEKNTKKNIFFWVKRF